MTENNDSDIELSPLLESLSSEYAKDPQSKKFLPLAEEYRKSKMYDEAIFICKEGLSNHPGYTPAMLTLAQCYTEIKKHDEAKDLLADIIEKNPDNTNALIQLGDLHFQKGEFEAAKDHYQKVRELRPSDELIHNRLKEIDVAEADWRPESIELAAETHSIQEDESDVSLDLQDSGLEDGPSLDLDLEKENQKIEELSIQEIPDSQEQLKKEEEETEAEGLEITAPDTLRDETYATASEDYSAEEQEAGEPLDINEQAARNEEIPEEDIYPVIAEVVELDDLSDVEIGDLASNELALNSDDIFSEGLITETEISESVTSQLADSEEEGQADEFAPLEVPESFMSTITDDTPEEVVLETPTYKREEVFGFELPRVEDFEGVDLRAALTGEMSDLKSLADEEELQIQEEPTEADSTVDVEGTTFEEKTRAPLTQTAAEIYEQQGLPDEALRIYKLLLERDPKDESLQKKVMELENRMIQIADDPSSEESRRKLETLSRWLENVEAFRKKIM